MGIRFGAVRIAMCLTALAAIFASGWAREARAAISYTSAGSTYSQNFNGLPLDLPQNASIEDAAAYADGWQDDVDPTTSPQADISIPGWHLYHPSSPAAENGFNGNQRVRVGPGANTGAFWLFGSSAGDADKALGIVGSATVAGNGANMYMGLQLVNNTGQTLNQFTVSYAGEQWRDGQSTIGEVLEFGYSVTATDATWFAPATPFTLAPALNFAATVVGGTSSGGTAVDGNTAGRVNGISATVSGITWADGQDLWIRWADPQLASNADDGLAIDDFSFSADVGGGNPTDITSLMSGLASSPSTWSNNQAPALGNTYRVLDTHTVTIDGPFAPLQLQANAGGTINFNSTGSAAHVPLIVIDDGAHLTETTSGDFALGDILAPVLGTLQLNGDVALGIDANSEFFLDMSVIGDGDIDFDSGADSTLWLTATQNHLGTIRFNGSGDTVMITESQGVGNLEMNSTGDNTLFYDPRVQADVGAVTFNQPGTIDHASTSVTPQRRLHGANDLTVNAPITVDLTKGFPDNVTQAEERRFLIGDTINGAADITVNGMAFNPTAGNTTLNEFELGSTGEPGTAGVETDTYSGTITGNDFLNMEIRRRLPDAKFVVGANTRMEMGFQVVSPDPTKNIQIGEIVVNSGGILEVGFEQGPVVGSGFFDGTGHHVHQLALTGAGSRDGKLTLNDGATLRMQINGINANQFDSISADGNVALNGTLNILVSPPGSQESTLPNDVWAPEVGQTFNIITTNSTAPATDFDDNGTVGAGDLTVWRGAFGTTAAGDADADGDTDGADFLAWQRDLGSSGAGGVISGTFDALVVTDPGGLMAGKLFQVIYSSTAVQLKVVTVALPVPEPSSMVLAGLALVLPVVVGRNRRRR